MNESTLSSIARIFSIPNGVNVSNDSVDNRVYVKFLGVVCSEASP